MTIFNYVKIGKEDYDWIISKLGSLFNLLGRILHRRMEVTKENASILFVDDEEFPVVSNLIKDGWNVHKVNDLENLQSDSVRRAHIIFVDYKGVGKILSEREEGIGLIKALKDTYGSKKRVILYSGYTIELGEHLAIVDNQLSKNSDTYEFEKMIRAELKKLND